MIKRTTKHKKIQRDFRHKRVRKSIVGSNMRPRLFVFRSNKYIYAQIIDDSLHKTLFSESDLKTKGGNKTERAKEAGKRIAKKAMNKDIRQVVFDRGGFKFHGRVKAVAEGAREGGLKF